MLIDFFYTLRAAKLPVSVKEYLTLLEALEAGVVGPAPRTLEPGRFLLPGAHHAGQGRKHYDKFDRAFAAYFKGVEMLADFTKEFRRLAAQVLERELSPEEKAAIEKWAGTS
jgi:uncharacterized protein with von Willebrand factor type A (vWA) domain